MQTVPLPDGLTVLSVDHQQQTIRAIGQYSRSCCELSSRTTRKRCLMLRHKLRIGRSACERVGNRWITSASDIHHDGTLHYDRCPSATELFLSVMYFNSRVKSDSNHWLF